MKKTQWVLIGIFLFAAFCSCEQAFAQKMDRIAAIVNGDVITEDEVAVFTKMTQMAEEAGLPADDPKKLRRELLERMIEDRLILQDARDMGLKPDEKMIEDRIKEIKLRSGSELAFEMALKAQGVSLAELRRKFGNQFLIYMAIQGKVRSRVQVSPREVTDYYESHQDEFFAPESVAVRSIFVTDKAKLAQVSEQLKEGRDFTDVFKDFSEKSDLGVVGRGQLKKELEDVLFSLEPGVVSRPVAAGEGHYIFLVQEKLPASKKSLDEVKDGIMAMLEAQKTEKMLKEWLVALKEKAYISIRE